MLDLIHMKVGDFVSVAFGRQVCITMLNEFIGKDGTPNVYQLNNGPFFHRCGKFIGSEPHDCSNDITSFTNVPVPQGVLQ